MAISGNYNRAKHYFEFIADDEEGLDEDAYASYMANKFLENEPKANVLALFRARNLYDGGYMRRAIEILKDLEAKSWSLSKEETTELHYRLARIYHSTGRLDQALQRYKKAAEEEQPGDQLYLSVYANYYQGEIYRQFGKLDDAQKSYEKALEFDDYFYQNGLENRTKIALDEVKNEIHTQASSNKR